LLRGSVVKNTSWVIGLVVYTGHETKIIKNSSKPLIKFSKLEDLLNWLMVGLIFIMIGISLAFAFMGRHWSIMMLGKSDYLEF
jgi:magnesium-transporting ATPase (P-type)